MPGESVNHYLIDEWGLARHFIKRSPSQHLFSWSSQIPKKKNLTPRILEATRKKFSVPILLVYTCIFNISPTVSGIPFYKMSTFNLWPKLENQQSDYIQC